MQSPNPNDFVHLYQQTTKFFLETHLVVGSPTEAEDVIAFEFACLQLTRCGTALGLNLIHPGTDISQLAKDHPLRQGLIDSDDMDYLTGGMRYMENKLRTSCSSSEVPSATRKLQGVLGPAPGVGVDVLTDQDRRLVKAMREVNDSRVNWQDNATSHSTSIRPLSAKDLVLATSRMMVRLVKLHNKFNALALHEVCSFQQQATSLDTIARLNKIANCQDQHLCFALESLSHRAPRDEAAAKVTQTNHDSTIKGLQIAGDIHGGSFNWTGSG